MVENYSPTVDACIGGDNWIYYLHEPNYVIFSGSWNLWGAKPCQRKCLYFFLKFSSNLVKACYGQWFDYEHMNYICLIGSMELTLPIRNVCEVVIVWEGQRWRKTSFQIHNKSNLILLNLSNLGIPFCLCYFAYFPVDIA